MTNGTPANSPPRALAADIGRVLREYISGQLRVSLILSGLYAVGFLLLGVPFWPILALVCGFSNLIPMFGPVAAIFLAAGLTWAARDVYRAMGVMGVFAVVQGLEGFYLTPRIVGRRVRLHPLAVFLALLVAGSMFGFLGLLLVVPVMAVAFVVWKHMQGR